ncbi:MAG: hypothetical protein P1P84_00975 [Deferrisomatales bacterium]|nr:hypothetical protein [Deferrisomatales bacterium]
MKKIIALIMAPLTLALLPLVATAQETVLSGTVRGYVAAATNAPPVVDKDDPAIGAERAFVVDTGDGYYFLPNVSTARLRQHATERVRVSGHLDGQRRSIRVSKIELQRGDQWNQIWSKKEQDRKQAARERRYLQD